MKKIISSFITAALLLTLPLILSTSGYCQEYAFVLKWGEHGSGPGQFMRPCSVAVDSLDNVYVVDMYNNRIQKFNSNGDFLTTWGSEGNEDGQFVGPIAVAVDSADNVYVIDTSNWEFWNNQIQKFSSNGDFLAKWGSEGNEDGRFAGPIAVAVDSADNVYVVEHDQIQKFNSNGVFLGTWGSWGTEEGQFSYPGSIAFDSADNVYVVDRFNSRIQMFDSNGVFLTKWGSFGTGDSQFSYPIGGVAVDSADNVFVVDLANNRVQMFDSNGGFIGWWGLDNTDFTGWHGPGTETWGKMAQYPYGDGQFRRPSGVAVDSADNVYVAGDQIMRIQKFSPSDITIEMSSFFVEEAKIEFKKKSDDDKIHVKGNLKLGSDSDGVEAFEDDVIVTIGLFSEMIILESKGKGDKWEYKRSKGSSNGIKDMKIEWKKGKKTKSYNEAKFDIHIDKENIGDMSDWENPVFISIQIGNDLGSEVIMMREHKHHWDYKGKKHH